MQERENTNILMVTKQYQPKEKSMFPLLGLSE